MSEWRDKGSCQEIVPNTIITIGIIFMFAILPQGEVVHVSYLVIWKHKLWGDCESLRTSSRSVNQDSASYQRSCQLVLLMNSHTWCFPKLEPNTMLNFHAAIRLSSFFYCYKFVFNYVPDVLTVLFDRNVFPLHPEDGTFLCGCCRNTIYSKKKTPWVESASELYRPSYRRLSAK
jgi:hypothetical protein